MPIYIPQTIDKRTLAEELARRKGLLPTPGQFKLKDYLFDKQLSFVLDPSPFKIGVTTRRAGKTISCVADLTDTCLNHPYTVNLYITLSRKNAKRLVWPEFKKLNLKFQLGGQINESDLSITYPNGSILYVLGASDRSSIEDFRGLAIKKVYLDESQSFPSYIEQLIDDVLGPALMDHNGQLILIGTPGPIPSGYFYDLTTNTNWASHNWSYFDNPFLPFLAQGITHKDMLERELRRRGVTVNDPSIQREWFGKWTVDENSLVYRYNAAINDYKALPEGVWTYILGVDLGFNDADALAVIAYSESYGETYLVDEVVTKQQDITSLCLQIDKLKDKYPISKIVVDTGGLGKKITEEISKRYEIPMVAAEKNRKAEYIELMNDVLRTGKFKIKATSLFAEDASKVEWDHDKSTPDRRIISSRYHSDICEAVLYAWRESYSYTYKAPKKAAEYGTREWSDAQAELMFQTELERLEAEKEFEDSKFLGEREEYQGFDFDNIQVLDRPPIRYRDKFNRQRGPILNTPKPAVTQAPSTKNVIVVCGVSGSGKSWACRQVADKFNYIPHDEHYKDHVQVITKELNRSNKTVITECPFGERVFKQALEANGLTVLTVFVIEDPDLIAERYYKRENKELPKNAYTRATTILNRALEWGSFYGTSEQILNHLKKI